MDSNSHGIGGSYAGSVTVAWDDEWIAYKIRHGSSWNLYDRVSSFFEKAAATVALYGTEG